MSARLSLCFVTREYPPETGYGGIGTYYQAVAQTLAQRGHTVVILSEALGAESYTVIEGVHVYRVRPRYSLSHLPFLWRFQSVWRGYRLAVAMMLRQIVVQHAVQLIESPELHAEPYLYSLFARLPLIVRLHTGTRLGIRFNPQPRTPRIWLNMHLENALLKYAKAISAPSHAVAEQSRRCGVRVAHYQVIPNGIDCQKFVPPKHEPDSLSLLFCGRLEYWKGADILCKALPALYAAFPSLQVYLAGADVQQPNGSWASDQLRLSVSSRYHAQLHFLDQVPHTKLVDHYQRATVVVVPSRWESFGLVAAEAMACGRAVVVSGAGGLAEVVENGISGLYFESENAQALAEAVLRLLSDATLRTRLGSAARQRTEAYYSIDRVCDQLEAFYESVIT
ncbi:MAG: glycosyltransferase family 1 protein [Chloroflexi bacterium CFX4]|nr:glycosyltransferase family 1 protein [Chloroflexi bacterium CFX4]MDL1923184.1 glycosyltransferase family 4 protein [Chloroflexi bacterium CFX3]